jgi:hypothetical protein
VSNSSYPFPRDTRQLGGDFMVDENARRLLRYFYFERKLFRALCGWVMGSAEQEVKIEFGRHIFFHADAAHKIRTRLTELRVYLPEIESFRDAEVDTFIAEMLLADNAIEFLSGAYGVLGESLERAYREHMVHTDQVADAPTIRMFKQILLDLEDMNKWGRAAVEAYIAGGESEAKAVVWRQHVAKLLRSIGGVSGAESRIDPPTLLRQTVRPPFKRSIDAARDKRMSTFDHTHDYDIADGTPKEPPGSFESRRLNLVRTQRDEMDAIETFGNVIFDMEGQPFDFDYDIARLCWDETRHTELGHKTLLSLGYDPFELQNRLLGIKVRTEMHPVHALAEINLFGEANIVRELKALSEESLEHNDTLTAHLFDYINADERSHLAKGIRWLRELAKPEVLATLQGRTKEVTIQKLQEMGILEINIDLNISHQELAKMIGE